MKNAQYYCTRNTQDSKPEWVPNVDPERTAKLDVISYGFNEMPENVEADRLCVKVNYAGVIHAKWIYIVANPVKKYAIKTDEGYFCYQGQTVWFQHGVKGWCVTSTDVEWLTGIAKQFRVKSYTLEEVPR